MKTETCIDPVPALVAWLSGEWTAGEVYGDEFPDQFNCPAVIIQFTGATSTYIRLQVIIKDVNRTAAMAVWTAIDALMNFWSPPICGLNNTFVKREDGSPRRFKEPDTKRYVVASYYLMEMGG